MSEKHLFQFEWYSHSNQCCPQYKRVNEIIFVHNLLLLGNKCTVTDSMGLGNENCTFNKISTHPCWYTLECSPPVSPLWKAWCTTAVAYLKQKENVNEQRWKNRCLRKIHSRLTFITSRTATEICKQVDSSCHRKAFIQFNGISIRKVRWCNCSSRNTGYGKC